MCKKRTDVHVARAGLLRRLSALLVVALLASGAASVFADDAGLLYLPKSTGEAVVGEKGTRIDYGNAAEGYIIIAQPPVDKDLRLTIFKGGESYTYTLNNRGRSEVYPLQMGSGRYEVEVYQHLKGNQYSVLETATFDVNLSDHTTPYLYPNQYVDYNQSTLAVAKSAELCRNVRSEKEAVEAVFAFVKKTIKYDKKKAKKVKAGYLPDLNEVFRLRKGICFDYAALMACMLRSQGIPTQLVIGYVNGKYYHAWNKVLIGGTWVLYDATFAATKTKGKSYREERRY